MPKMRPVLYSQSREQYLGAYGKSNKEMKLHTIIPFLLSSLLLAADPTFPVFPMADGTGTPITSTSEPSSHTGIDAACYQSTNPWTIAGKDADGATPTTNPLVIAGLDGGGSVESLNLDSNGNPTVNQGSPPWSVTYTNSTSVSSDKSTFTYGTSNFDSIGGVFQDTSPTLTTGQGGAVRLTNNRGIHINVRDSSGNEMLAQKTMGNSIPVTIASDQASGVDSSGNSTTTTLGSNGVFTGTFENVEGYATISFSVFADQASATGGLSVQWSPDGTNADVSDNSNVNASAGRAFSLTPKAKFFRLVYTNGTSAQGAFRLKTVYHFTGTGLISKLLSSNIDSSNYAQTVRSVMSAQNAAGNYTIVPYGQQTMANSLPVTMASDQAAIPVTTLPTGTNFNFSFGDVTTTATAQALVARTTYTEQSTNAQRSIKSSSANDTSAGTGARTVTITYYDSTGAGPNTETDTLNGTTAVNTTNTNICFIEKMVVATVGSGNSNAGTITLNASTGGAGAVIGTIGVGDNQTFWAHHYVASGKSTFITGTSNGSTSTTVGAGALFVIKSFPINSANAVELQVSDFVTLFGQSSTFARTYLSPIKIAGPARVNLYVTPSSTTSNTYRASFDFYE